YGYFGGNENVLNIGKFLVVIDALLANLLCGMFILSSILDACMDDRAKAKEVQVAMAKIPLQWVGWHHLRGLCVTLTFELFGHFWWASVAFEAWVAATIS